MAKKTTEKENNQADKIRHSLSHLMSMAVLERFPKTGLGVGPVIENGFYQDYDLEKPLSESDFSWIEKRMRELIKKNLKFIKKKERFEEALNYYKNDPYKTELINDLKKDGEKDLSFYDTDWYHNLCKGPHVKSTKEIDPFSFKLIKVAGAYWRGDEKRPMLQRIYGVAFETKEKLDEYLKKQEEAEKRDHRKLGKELDLFTFSDLVGGGLPLFTPKGALVRRLINGYVEDMQLKENYTQVWTPQIAKAELFKTSGHYDKYKNDMFRVVSNYSDEEFFLKPMNCPQHTQIYASRPRSYRDLPIRLTDFAMLYRDEKPGELSGLARVRSFSQDDCHIFCREDQVDEEIDKALAMTKEIMNTFNFKYRYRLSTRDLNHPEKYIGDPKVWSKVEKWSEKIMKRNKIDYFDGPGEAAFYAPKMDLMATDALGREWQLSTIQIDYFLPERFNLSYTDKDGKEKRPIMLHRAILGSSERFIMVLIEHFAGAFPVWLAPTQALIIPITDKQATYCRKLNDQLLKSGIRSEFNDKPESMGRKIRDGEMKKIPYLIVVGEKEQKAKMISVRSRNRDLGLMKPEKLISQIITVINKKKTV